MTKKSTQKFKYLENEKSFYGEIKSIFHISKGLSELPQTLECDFTLGQQYDNTEVFT